MNETIRTLTNRRSVRKYKKAQICDEDLHLILQAGMNAASAKGIQPVPSSSFKIRTPWAA